MLERLEGKADYDTHFDQSVTLSWLGHCASELGNPLQAAEFYRRAIAIAETLNQTRQVKLNIAGGHYNLSGVLLVMGRYPDAKKELEFSLDIANELGDDRNRASAIFQLGSLALILSNLNKARDHYTEALSAIQSLGEDLTEALIWHQLGMVARKLS